MSNELKSEVFRDFTTRPPKNHLRVSYRVEPRQLREPYKNSKKNICNLCIYFLTHLQHCDGNNTKRIGGNNTKRIGGNNTKRIGGDKNPLRIYTNF